MYESNYCTKGWRKEERAREKKMSLLFLFLIILEDIIALSLLTPCNKLASAPSFLNTRAISFMNASEIVANASLPFVSFVKTSVENHRRRCQRRRTFLRKDLMSCGRKSATETETKEKAMENEVSLEKHRSWEQEKEVETQKGRGTDRDREGGMSFSF